ncbi:(2Fe-2S)-binding protein [Pseudoroseicyclus tamaricis]|uniref:(2Fe-2S)-binding protein n=1 Tax=Pseudoroseicyclus tamaricis TaxID=2705421 RepID=A0A6B2JRR4_9RHOB|nr:(2Fe-2S)-binding protein [Pseudoroseicyclus tamaricis]NDV00680.1 (2Fe-2S)-binding protein [Pseudoroseicyclus tamaricis]
MVQLTVNGQTHDVDVEADTPLLWVIREQLGLTGTKYGCGVGACGACTVNIDGFPTRSCTLAVGDLREGEEITTIEGLSEDLTHPVQIAWAELDVPQCGYCQSGQIMAAAALLKDYPNPTDDDIDALMMNICRCGTYNRIRAGIKRASELL